MNKPGLLVCLSSPSGGGKTTICHRLIDENQDYQFSVSCTTRPRREHEVDGVDYHFMDKAEFRNQIESDNLAEYEEVHGNFYGTLKSAVRDALGRQQVLMVDIDVKGALSLKKLYEDLCLTIFIQPPSMEVLKERLVGRGTETESTFNTRMKRINLEMEYREQFDKVVINNALDDAVREVNALIENKRLTLMEDENYVS